MILSLIIGVILIIVGFTLKANESPLSKFSNLFRIFGIVVILIGVLSSAFKQIDAGKVGVKSLTTKLHLVDAHAALAMIWNVTRKSWTIN